MATIKYVIAFICLVHLPSFSSWMDGRSSAIETINTYLARYTDLYEFDEHDGGFFGELGPAYRWQEVIVRKHQFITNNIIHPIDEALRQLAEKNTLHVGRVAMDKKSLALILKGVLSLVTCPNPLSCLVDLAKIEADCLLNNCNYDTVMADLQRAKKEILYALAKDPCKENEKKIVHHWHTMPVGTRKVASRLLLELRRETGKKLIECKEHLEDLVSFPTQFKLLPPGFIKGKDILGGPHGALNQFVEKIFTQSDLKIYSEKTKIELKNSIKKICRQAHLAHDYGCTDTIKGKQIFLFYGDPGTGKSHAALTIAKELTLPVYEIRALREEDFGYGKLSGNSEYLDSKLGIIFKPFYVKDADGKGFMNPVIIINEVDRMMGKHNGMLKPLMDLFDETIKKIYSTYFGADMDFSGLIWILTANTDFGLSGSNNTDPSKFKNGKDPLAALRDRMKLIHFDHIPEQHIKIFLSDFITTQKLFLYSSYYDSQEALSMKDKLMSFIAKRYQNQSIRFIEEEARRLSDLPEEEWDSILPDIQDSSSSSASTSSSNT